MNYLEIKDQLISYRQKDKRMFVSSSFQTHSIPLLHLISRIDKEIPVIFLNTGYLFPETLEFRDQISSRLGLQVINVESLVPKIHQRNESGYLYFTSDTDRCCYLNKVQPMEPVLQQHDVWINGVRKDQNANRAKMKDFASTPSGCERFHPILDWSSKRIYEYRMEFDLPEHPLEKDGYFSIGCEPCTSKFDMEDERGGRWLGQQKTECGLHTELQESI